MDYSPQYIALLSFATCPLMPHGVFLPAPTLLLAKWAIEIPLLLSV